LGLTRGRGLKKGARLCITMRGLKSKQFELVRSGMLPYAKGALIEPLAHLLRLPPARLSA